MHSRRVVLGAWVVAGALSGCGGGKQSPPADNSAPVATDDVVATARNMPVVVAVLANDSDPDGDALTVTSVGTPAHGTAAVMEGGPVRYTPAAAWTGLDQFTYAISDGKGGTASAKVSVQVGVTCTDSDGDGFLGGPGCPSGPDCDDHNAAIHPGAVEVCGDWLDNNCNGETDETCVCLPGAERACSSRGDPASITAQMACRPGHQRCVDGGWEATCWGEVPPQTETCNGMDDDCNGQVDEGLRNAIGQCLETNPTVPPEDCGPDGEGNGLDDNGNGVVDEGCTCAVPGADPSQYRLHQPCYTGPIQTLGRGPCHGGFRDCQAAGAWGPCTGQLLPAEETCGDGIDNDCDGLVDETCSSCTGTGVEVCDGVDNDCDGLVDEGVTNRCGGCGTPAATEVCGDGLDNNCNGEIDEGCGCTAAVEPCYPGMPATAGVGPCTWGARECGLESVGDCTGYVLPGVELCGPDGRGNGVDEDCDGVPDNGCTCVDGQARPCGSATGACRYGAQTCLHGEWGACTGGTGPQTEVCDGIDNDCDGLVDEGVLNACGKCKEPCYLQPVDPAAQGQRDESVVVLGASDPDNPTGRAGISLSKNAFIPPYLWAANHEFNTVTKFNTDTETEEGQYWVGANPSRTAVDLDGNVWVGGRDDGRLTKILWDLDACPDRNGNGHVDTSRNEGGVVLQVNGAEDPLADECVVFSQVINPGRPSIRGIAAAPNGRMWIGFTAGGVQGVDPRTFEIGTFYPGDAVPRWVPDAAGVLQPAGDTMPAGGIYGLVVDARGSLYTSKADAIRNSLARFDTNTEQWVAVYDGLCGVYGITVDARNRIWMGSYPHCTGVNMFDPIQNRFYAFGVPLPQPPTPHQTSAALFLTGNVFDQVVNQGVPRGNDMFMTTGVGVEPATGDVWTSFYPLGYTGRLHVNDADISQSTWTFIGTTRQEDNSFLPGAGPDLRGVGFDRHGYAWTLGLTSSSVFKLDPATNERAASLPTGKPIGQGTHYTYSDFTGSTALSFTAPRGFWRYNFVTAFGMAQVDAVLVTATVPPQTSVGTRIRALDVNGAPGPWVPADTGGAPTFVDYPSGQVNQQIQLSTLGGPVTGHSFQVELRLTTSTQEVRPLVHDVKLGWERP